MNSSNGIKELDKTSRPEIIITKLKHYIITLILFIFSLLLFGSFVYYLSRNNVYSSISLGLATTFFTAAVVDITYKLALMKDIWLNTAAYLMLNKEVQTEILKEDKKREILDCALEFKLGEDLKEPVKSLIDKLDGYKNSGSYTIQLRKIESGSQNLRNDFYYLDLIVEFEEVVSSDKIVIIATDNENEYTDESREDKGNKYIHFLPDFLDQIGEEFFFHTRVKIDNDELEKLNWNQLNEGQKVIGKNHFIKHEYKRDDNSRRQARIQYHINTILSKKEHLFFCDFNRAYKTFKIDFDYKDTDIVKCDPYLPFSDPNINYIGNIGKERRIIISIEDWILPPSIVCFVWY